MKKTVSLAFLSMLVAGCTQINAPTRQYNPAPWVSPAALGEVSGPYLSRVVAPFWEKSFFNPDYETRALSEAQWYYRMTVVDTPPNTTALSIGDGHWLHPETIKWEITEKHLIGRRAYAPVLGAEGEAEAVDAETYSGVPVVAFAINEHFDVIRSYDTSTLEPTNEVRENASDRKWEERKFFRVDWSKNVANQLRRTDPGAEYLGGRGLDNGTTHAIENDNPSNPNHYRFESDYAEVTTRQGVTADFLAYIGRYGEGFKYDPTAPMIDVRHSFFKKPKTNYEPLHFPDHVYLKDGSGEEVRDPNGRSVTVPIWDRFGFYRASFSGRQTWDERRGSVESGKNLNITRFNIWEESVDPGGDTIPMHKRTPKPIVYHTNVHHPSALLNASRRVAQEWSDVFKEVVHLVQPAKYPTKEDVPEMFLLRENSCSLTNLKTVGEKFSRELKQAQKQARFTLDDIRSRIEKANRRHTSDSFTERHNQEAQALSDLEKICSALEYATMTHEDPFKYQRPGDLRYNLMNLLPGTTPTGWSGLGPMMADGLTGEIIQSVANVNLWYIDRRAAKAMEQIDAINGQVSFGDMIFGNDVADYIRGKTREAAVDAEKVVDAAAISKMDDHFWSLNESGSALKRVSPLADNQAMESFSRDGRFEAKLIDPRVEELVFAGMSPSARTDNPANLREDLLHTMSPLRGQDILAQYDAQKHEHRNFDLSVKDPPEFLDNLVMGVAFQYKNMDPEERYYKIREAVYTAVMLHEVGHNVGLVHNMAGSSDALNYGPKFWETQELPKDLTAALGSTDDEAIKGLIQNCINEEKTLIDRHPTGPDAPLLDTQTCLRQQEGMYSSIMDYHAMWNSDLNGLGRYDKAAVKFGYAQLLEVFPDEAVKVASSHEADLDKWLFLNDWKKIPAELVNGTQNIENRTHVKLEWDRNYTAMAAPKNTVPYRYCPDSSGTFGPNCKAFDFGPDMKTQAQWLKTRYWQHYFFTHFHRDRLWEYNTQLFNVVRSDLRIFDDFTSIMQWYYFNKATKPEFTGSDAEKDFLTATIMGLNHFSHVLGHPEPGNYVTAPYYAAEGAIVRDAGTNRLGPSPMMVSWDDLGRCSALAVTERKDGVGIVPRDGQSLVYASLGDGRPYQMGFNDDYEDWYLTYVGSFYPKVYAAAFLARSGRYFPKTEEMQDPGFYAANWYRLFPEQVGKLFYDVIMSNKENLGPLMSPEGKLVHRDLLTMGGESPDYSGFKAIAPKMSSVIPFRFMFYGGLLTSNYMTSELNLANAMRVVMRGEEDDLGILDGYTDDLVSSFEHPQSGNIYRGLKVGDNPIAYDLVKKLNTLKTRYTRLEACVQDEAQRALDSFCSCITQEEKREGGTYCSEPRKVAVGDETCSLDDLKKRRDLALEQMEFHVGFADDMRWFAAQVLK